MRDAARAAWLAQRDADDGCQLLAQTMFDDKVFTQEDVWRRLRQAAESGRQRAARAAAQMLGKQSPLKAINEVWDNPARFLTRRGDLGTARRGDIVAFALARMAAGDAGAAAVQMSERWDGTLGRERAAWTWAVIAKQARSRLDPTRSSGPTSGLGRLEAGKNSADRPDWSDDTLDWHARGALARAGREAALARPAARDRRDERPTERAERLGVLARPRPDRARRRARPKARLPAPMRTRALGTRRPAWASTACSRPRISARASRCRRARAASAQAERAGARGSPGCSARSRSRAWSCATKARREWNFTLRGMGDRQLLAAAQWACDVNDWRLCINTSERTKTEVDLLQRYPTPFRDIPPRAGRGGLEPAFVFGLIRQETRFMPELRSHVGAAGLMQIMPATAKWTARKSGTRYSADQIADPQVNLRLGTYYLKLVLDSFGGSRPWPRPPTTPGPPARGAGAAASCSIPPSGPRTCRSSRRATTSRR